MIETSPGYVEESTVVIRRGRGSVPYCVLPTWVALAGLPGQAQAAYWQLALHLSTQRTDRDVWPTRSSLARRLRLRRPQSVDPYLDALVEIGAIEKRVVRCGTNRMRKRLVITVHFEPPADYTGPMSLADLDEDDEESAKPQVTPVVRSTASPVVRSTASPVVRSTAQELITKGTTNHRNKQSIQGAGAAPVSAPAGAGVDGWKAPHDEGDDWSPDPRVDTAPGEALLRTIEAPDGGRMSRTVIPRYAPLVAEALTVMSEDEITDVLLGRGIQTIGGVISRMEALAERVTARRRQRQAYEAIRACRYCDAAGQRYVDPEWNRADFLGTCDHLPPEGSPYSQGAPQGQGIGRRVSRPAGVPDDVARLLPPHLRPTRLRAS